MYVCKPFFSFIFSILKPLEFLKRHNLRRDIYNINGKEKEERQVKTKTSRITQKEKPKPKTSKPKPSKK